MSEQHHHEHDYDHKHLTNEDRLNAARKLCEAKGERFTPLRAHVFELIIEDGNAVKAYDLLDRLKPELGSPKPPTVCLLYTSPSPRDRTRSRMPSSA